IPQHLDCRRQCFAEEKEGIGNQTDRAVAEVEEQVPMYPQRLEQASLPALALPSEHANRRRDLRPRHRIRNERHRVREMMLAQISVQSHNEVHVFRDTASAVSTDREQMGAFKESERARNDQVSA